MDQRRPDGQDVRSVCGPVLLRVPQRTDPGDEADAGIGER